MESPKLKKLIFRSIIIVLVCLSFKSVLSTVPIITIAGVEEGGYYSTAVYPEISISDADLFYSTTTLKKNSSADSVYVNGTEIKKDGKYLLYAYAVDLEDNSSEMTINFVVDKSKPRISIKGVENNAYYSTSVYFKVRISETNPVKEIITLDGIACLENETVWVEDEGNHKLLVDTLDKAGNENQKEYDFTIDKTLPLINILGVEEDQYYTTFIAPQISIIDANYDPGGIIITLNGETFINGTEIKEDGDYILSVTASDHALNISFKEIHFKVKVSPKLSIITRPGDAAVYLDGDYSYPGTYRGGTAPGDKGGLLIEKNISCGKHLLRIKKPGYVDYTELINLNIGEFVEKDIDLVLWKKEIFYEGQLLLLDLGSISLRPWVTDYDQDGKKDLIVRTSDGKDYLYLNAGEDNIPGFDSGVLINNEIGTFFEIFYKSGIESPASSIKGSSRGQIHFDGIPILINYETVDVGGHSWPFVFDLDHDGRDDLISGAQNGRIYFFKNIGSWEDPVFDSARLIQTGSEDLDVGSYSRPFIIDWNNDSLYDLLVGSSKGVYLYIATDKMIDNTAPVITVETSPVVFPGQWINSDVRVNFIVNDDIPLRQGFEGQGGFDPIGSTYYSFDSMSWIKGNEVLLTNEGSYGLFYYSVDDAGNQEKAKQIKINIDKTLPVITDLIVPDINEHTDIIIKINADIDDGLSGLDITLNQYSLDQGNTWTNFDSLTLDWKNLSGQVIRFRIYAKDMAGNESYSEERVEFIEEINDKPEITFYLPADKILKAKEGGRIDFKVEVFDTDNEQLELTWYVDSKVVNTGNPEWTYYPGYDDSGRHEIKFIVTDPVFSVEENWEVNVENVTVRPPLNLSAGTGIGGCVSLKWDENKYYDLLGYNIYRDGTKVNKTLYVDEILRYTQDEQLPRQLNYLDAGLVDGTQYMYFVRAVDIDGSESDNSNEVQAIPEDVSAPSVPVNLKINSNGSLSWDSPEGEDPDLAGYNIYKGQGSRGEGQWEDKKINISYDVNSYQLAELLPGVEYYFAVSAYDNYNKESEKSNTVSFVFNDSLPPSQVQGVRIRATGKTGELKIIWQKNIEPDLSGYKIYIGLDPSEYYASFFTDEKNKFVLSGLNDDNKYFIAVSCVDTQGNEGLKSFDKIGIPHGNSTFIPNPETLIIDPMNKGVKLSWNAVPNVDGYKLYIGRSEDLVVAPLIISDTTFTFNNLLNNKKYYAAVSSFKGRDESERVSGIVLPEDESTPDVPAGLTCLSGGALNQTVQGGDGTSLILSWSLNREWDLAGYKIAYKTGSEYFSEPVMIGKTNRFDINGLIEGEQYYIVLFALDTENNTSDPAIITGIPLKNNYTYNSPPSAPVLDVSCEKGYVRLNWTSSGEPLNQTVQGGEIDDYRIYRREAGEIKYKKIYKTSNLTYRNMTVEKGKIYYYVVTAYRKNSFPKESLFSNEVVMRPKFKFGDIDTESDVPVEGQVDGYDLIIMSISFGSGIGDGYYNPNADLNGDGIIDGVDLSILANNFGIQY